MLPSRRAQGDQACQLRKSLICAKTTGAGASICCERSTRNSEGCIAAATSNTSTNTTTAATAPNATFFNIANLLRFATACTRASSSQPCAHRAVFLVVYLYVLGSSHDTHNAPAAQAREFRYTDACARTCALMFISRSRITRIDTGRCSSLGRHHPTQTLTTTRHSKTMRPPRPPRQPPHSRPHSERADARADPPDRPGRWWRSQTSRAPQTLKKDAAGFESPGPGETPGSGLRPGSQQRRSEAPNHLPANAPPRSRSGETPPQNSSSSLSNRSFPGRKAPADRSPPHAPPTPASSPRPWSHKRYAWNDPI